MDLDHAISVISFPNRLEENLPLHLRRECLRALASRIRDELDPIIAREGPKALHPDDALDIHTVLLDLTQHRISVYSIRYSSIHLAVEAICGKATRWPSKLADLADHVKEEFALAYGPLQKLKPVLFGHGGRLWGVCRPADVTKAVSCGSGQSGTYTDPVVTATVRPVCRGRSTVCS
jgi:hypothetical protein